MDYSKYTEQVCRAFLPKYSPRRTHSSNCGCQRVATRDVAGRGITNAFKHRTNVITDQEGLGLESYIIHRDRQPGSICITSKLFDGGLSDLTHLFRNRHFFRKQSAQHDFHDVAFIVTLIAIINTRNIAATTLPNTCGPGCYCTQSP